MEEKLFEGKEIIYDESDKNLVTLNFLSNGVIILFDKEDWVNIKKELLEALKR